MWFQFHINQKPNSLVILKKEGVPAFEILSSNQSTIVQEVVADVHAPDLSSPHARPTDPNLVSMVMQLQTSHQQLITEQSLFRETLASLLAGRVGVNPPGLRPPSTQPLREVDMSGIEASPGGVSCPPPLLVEIG